MAEEEIAKSGLLPVKFTASGHRAIYYLPDEHLLLVQSPYEDKTNLKRLGGTWHPSEPKGWSWYFTLPNLNMLIDKIPFNEDDVLPNIEAVDQKVQRYERPPLDAIHEQSDSVI